jgi:hypothetical protein
VVRILLIAQRFLLIAQRSWIQTLSEIIFSFMNEMDETNSQVKKELKLFLEEQPCSQRKKGLGCPKEQPYSKRKKVFFP